MASDAAVLTEYQQLIESGKARPGKDARAKAEANVAARERTEQQDAGGQQSTASEPTTSSSTSAAPSRSIAIGGTGAFNFWIVVAFALVIGAISVVVGHWSSGLFVALMALLVIGALFPPIAVGIGFVVVLDLLLVHHNALNAQLTSSLRTAPAGSSGQPGGTTQLPGGGSVTGFGGHGI